MSALHRQRGAALLVLAACLVLGVVALFAVAAASPGPRHARDRATERALAQAREALLAHATARPIDRVVGPGYLPCPDHDGDGWAESTCGSLSGDVGQERRLGRLPWKTLGLGELRDGHGEPLWYAVSTKYKGLLNCAASAPCIDMTPGAALGTITLRDPTGTIVLDGRAAGAAAVVIAAGPALASQARGCLREACDPRDYLDEVPGIEGNSAFGDRASDGFIQGPVRRADGAVVANDRLLAIDYADLMPRIMARVAREVAQCIRTHAGAAPSRAPCRHADPDHPSERVPFSACNIDAAARPGWWNSWGEHVAFDVAADGAVTVLVSARPRPPCALAASPEADDRLADVVHSHP